MEGFGKDAQASGTQDEEGFQAYEQECRANAEEGSALLFLDVLLQPMGKGHASRLPQVHGVGGIHLRGVNIRASHKM